MLRVREHVAYLDVTPHGIDVDRVVSPYSWMLVETCNVICDARPSDKVDDAGHAAHIS